MASERADLKHFLTNRKRIMNFNEKEQFYALYRHRHIVVDAKLSFGITATSAFVHTNSTLNAKIVTHKVGSVDIQVPTPTYNPPLCLVLVGGEKRTRFLTIKNNRNTIHGITKTSGLVLCILTQ